MMIIGEHERIEIKKTSQAHFPVDDVVLIQKKDHLFQMEAVTRESKPSWKKYGKGSATLSITSHVNRKYLSLNLEETAWADEPGKKDVTKSTYISLDEETAGHVMAALGDLRTALVVAGLAERFPKATSPSHQD